MQGEAELGAIIGNALVGMEDLLELRLVTLVARIGLADIIEPQTTEFLEAARMLFFEGAAALEEVGKVLPRMRKRGRLQMYWGRGDSTDPDTRNAGLEAVQQRRNSHVRVQDLADALLRLRIVGRSPLFRRRGRCLVARRGGSGAVPRGVGYAGEFGIEAVGAVHGRDRGRGGHGGGGDGVYIDR